MAKLCLGGFSAAVSPDDIRAGLERYGEVIDVTLITEGNPDKPLAMVEFAMDPISLHELANRLDGLWHDGQFLRVFTILRD